MLYEFEALQEYVEEQKPAVIFEELAEEDGLERLLEAWVPPYRQGSSHRL